MTNLAGFLLLKKRRLTESVRENITGNIYSGNIYYGDFAAVSFPSGLFTAVPDVRATIQSAPATVWVATASNSKPSTSSTQTVRLLSGGPEMSISVTVSYRAVGRWK